MNLFRKHKKFEEQLSEQLGDMEVKPSTSLWDSIDANIANDSFETGMQDSLENFELIPNPETWDKIAAELPSEKISNRFLKYYVLAVLALLFASGIYVANELGISEQESTVSFNGDIRELGKVDREMQNEESYGSVDDTKTKARHESLSKMSVLQSQPANKGAVSDKPNSPNIVNAQKTVVLKGPSANTVYTQNSAASPKEVSGVYKETVIPVVLVNETNNGKQPTSHETTINSVASQTTSDNQQTTNPIIPNSLTKSPSGDTYQTPNPITSDSLASKTSNMPTPNNDSRVVPEIKPDSTLLAQKIAALNEKPNQEELTRFSISMLAGVHLSFATYSAPQGTTLNFEQNIAFRKQVERTAIDWAGGFMVDYRLNQKWMLSSGVMMVNFYQKFDYDVTQAISPANPNEVGGAPISSPQDSLLLGNQYSNRIRYSWTEIPLYINYTIKKGVRWDVDMQGGLSYAFINTVDGGMVSYDNKGVFILRNKESFPQISNAIFITAMPQLSYKFGQAVSIGIVPTVKYSLNSIIGNERWIQQHPYFVGMNICLRKRF